MAQADVDGALVGGASLEAGSFLKIVHSPGRRRPEPLRAILEVSGAKRRPRTGAAMTIAYYVIIVLHVIACLFLIGVVLLQQGKSQDLASAFGGGGTQTAFGPRGSANVLSRATTILAGVFMVTCLALSIAAAGHQRAAGQGPDACRLAQPGGFRRRRFARRGSGFHRAGRHRARRPGLRHAPAPEVGPPARRRFSATLTKCRRAPAPRLAVGWG